MPHLLKIDREGNVPSVPVLSTCVGATRTPEIARRFSRFGEIHQPTDFLCGARRSCLGGASSPRKKRPSMKASAIIRSLKQQPSILAQRYGIVTPPGSKLPRRVMAVPRVTKPSHPRRTLPVAHALPTHLPTGCCTYPHLRRTAPCWIVCFVFPGSAWTSTAGS